MEKVKNWIVSLPPITTIWFLGTIFVSVLARYDIVDIKNCHFSYTGVVEGGQIWRILTSSLLYPITSDSICNFVAYIAFLVKYSSSMETIVFAGRPIRYTVVLLCNWTCCLIVVGFYDMPLLADSLVMSVLYIWCSWKSGAVFDTVSGIQFRRAYLPWVLLAIQIVVFKGGMSELIGMTAGHICYVTLIKYPEQNGGMWQIIQLPALS